MESAKKLHRPIPSAKYSTRRKKHVEQTSNDPFPLIDAAQVKTRKVRVMEAFKNRGKMRLKDKNGNNIKQHFGIWKYFIGTKTANKEKFYISWDCRKYLGPVAFEMAKKDKDRKRDYQAKLGKIGLEGMPNEIIYWSIPSGICEKFRNLFGITQLYPWQIECLKTACETEENLIYSVPTSGGKSLVAEIMMLRAVLCKKKRAIYVLPYISIVSEKAEYLKKITEDVNVKIEEFHGLADNIWSANVDIALATPEKANSVFNKLIEECSYTDISYVIIDEFHLVSEPSRGAQLELLISKIQTLEKLQNAKIQIVAMTATISNLGVYAKWIHAKVYENKSRPTPLAEYVMTQGTLYSPDLKELALTHSSSSNDMDDVNFI